MNIFISWSGTTSMQIAEELKKWIPKIIQSAKPYYTPSDIEKGARWDGEINKKLSESLIGLICLTRDNTEKPWILFEAGALSNRLDKSKVCPILFGLKKSEITGPLAGVQLTEFNKVDFLKLLKSINNSLENNSIGESLLVEMFDTFYPKLEEEVNKILSNDTTTNQRPQRSEKDILEEILDLVRKQSNNQLPTRTPVSTPEVVRRRRVPTPEEWEKLRRNLVAGDRVRHDSQGLGTVIDVNIRRGHEVITVKFDDGNTYNYFTDDQVLSKIF